MLELLLEPVTVALPAGMRSPVGSELRAGLGAVFASAPDGSRGKDRPALALDVERPARITRHDWRRALVDLPAFAGCGLPARSMGRTIADDPLFFGAALAGGGVLAEMAGERTTAHGAPTTSHGAPSTAHAAPTTAHAARRPRAVAATRRHERRRRRARPRQRRERCEQRV